MRWVFHVDMDAFYASVEQRDNPELRGKPVVVGSARRRGVVAAASYEVRRFGVHSAMPMVRALRLCPHAAVVSPRMSVYAQDSRAVMDVLKRYSPTVEPLSLDEAFLDMTGSEGLFGPVLQTAARIKQEVFEATNGLTCSVGIGANKFLAKLASDLEKPNGITLIPQGEEQEFIAGLPIRAIWGVGPKTADRMYSRGLRTIGDVAATDEDRLIEWFGPAMGARLHELSHGRDVRRVSSKRTRRSVSASHTMSYDIAGREAVQRELRSRAATVAGHLRRKGLRARGIRVSVRYTADFSMRTRQKLIPVAVDDSATLYLTGCELLEDLDLDHPIRLVGLAAYELSKHVPRDEEDDEQLALFSPTAARTSRLEHTLDAINDKFSGKIRRGGA